MDIVTKQRRIVAAIAFALILSAGAYAADFGASTYDVAMRDAIERDDHQLEPMGFGGGASFDRDAETAGAYVHPLAARSEVAGVQVAAPRGVPIFWRDSGPAAPSNAAYMRTMRDAYTRNDLTLLPEGPNGGATFDNAPMR